MTRRQMVTICVEDQIKRGVLPSEGKEKIINGWLKGAGGCKPISKSEAQRWYDRVMERNRMEA